MLAGAGGATRDAFVTLATTHEHRGRNATSWGVPLKRRARGRQIVARRPLAALDRVFSVFARL